MITDPISTVSYVDDDDDDGTKKHDPSENVSAITDNKMGLSQIPSHTHQNYTVYKF